jgi:hypothetical protein
VSDAPRDTNPPPDDRQLEETTADLPLVAELFDGAIPLCCWAMIEPEDDTRLPLLHLCPVDRPDVLDVPHALGREGSIDVEVKVDWRFVKARAGTHGVMIYEMVSPVACRFKVSVNLDEHLELLDTIAEMGAFDLTTGPDCPCPDTEIVVWGRTPCRTDAIVTALLYEG